MKVIRKAIKHLKDDVKGYAKERKYLKKEMKEDRELMRDLNKGKTNGRKKKKACCKGCEEGHDCEGRKSKARKRVKDEKKSGRVKRRRVQKSKKG